jgi:hypothetical protein
VSEARLSGASRRSARLAPFFVSGGLSRYGPRVSDTWPIVRGFRRDGQRLFVSSGRIVIQERWMPQRHQTELRGVTWLTNSGTRRVHARAY